MRPFSGEPGGEAEYSVDASVRIPDTAWLTLIDPFGPESASSAVPVPAIAVCRNLRAVEVVALITFGTSLDISTDVHGCTVKLGAVQLLNGGDRCFERLYQDETMTFDGFRLRIR